MLILLKYIDFKIKTTAFNLNEIYILKGNKAYKYVWTDEKIVKMERKKMSTLQAFSSPFKNLLLLQYF